MTQIEQIRAEIERRIKLYSITNEKEQWIVNTYWSVLSFLDTLQEPEVDLNGKVTFDNKTILRAETDVKKKRVLEIIGLEESCCNYPLNYENETDDCYYEEYNDRIYIDGNITFNQMREIVEYIENK